MCKRFNITLFLLLLIINISDGKKYRTFGEENSSDKLSFNDKSLLIDVDIYNRPYAIPYLLRQLEQITCPCQKCYLDLRVYHVYKTPVEMETLRLVQEWVAAINKLEKRVFTETIIYQWTAKTTDDQANRLGAVLKRVSELDITYLVMLDSMIVLLEPNNILSTLISKDKPIMAPLLRSTKEMYTSTFYLTNDQSNGFYNYKQIYERKKLGCFHLNGGIKDFYVFNFNYPQVRQVFLEDLSDDVSQQKYPIDFIAKENSIPMYVCNREVFGYITAQISDGYYGEDAIRDLYFHMLIEHQLNGPSQTYLPAIPQTSLISIPKSNKGTKFGLDEIYVINLVRRTDRRQRLEQTFDILNISARFFEAVDGKHTIDQSYLENLNVRLLPNYEDPYNRRPMNYGELGCFFSHYFIWQDMIKNQYSKGALILEDDVRFDAHFKTKLEKVLSGPSFDWDIIYIGRKIMRPNEENYENLVETYLIEPSYSHWTVGYILSLRGAQILVDEKPIQKILPVDEYLPIMYDHHPNQSWKSHFQNRKLKAYAFYPAIATPTHYFGEPNYISDTENTTVFERQENTVPVVDTGFVSVDVVKSQATIDESTSMRKDEL